MNSKIENEAESLNIAREVTALTSKYIKDAYGIPTSTQVETAGAVAMGTLAALQVSARLK